MRLSFKHFNIQCNDELAFYIESLNWLYPVSKSSMKISLSSKNIAHDAKEKVWTKI